MIHVCRKCPEGRATRLAAITRDYVPESIAPTFNMRTFAQLRLDFIAYRLFVKRGRGLLCQRPNDIEQFVPLHPGRF